MSDEIDFKIIFNFFLRNKKFISAISILAFILSCIYAFTLKKIWQGEFQIVIKDVQSPSSQIKTLNDEFGLSSLYSAFGQTADIETQIGILESPLIMMPIFKYVKEYKNNQNKKEEFKFSAWRKDNLKIERQGNSMILDIKYRDNDKELIIPVLEKISIAYQNYSLRDKNKFQERTKNYLNEQIKIYDKKITNTIRLAQEFALEEDLILIDKDEIPANLNNLEVEIVENQSKYTANDPLLLRTIEKRNLLLKALNKRTIGILNAQELKSKAMLGASDKPVETIIKYKELLRNAIRDETTLISLKNELRKFELDSALRNDPWEMINQPILRQNPVAPAKKRIGLLGIFAGLFVGTLIAFLKEKTSQKIFSKELLESVFQATSIEISKIEKHSKSFKLLRGFLIKQSHKKISFINLGEVNADKINSIEKLLINDASIKKEINFISELSGDSNLSESAIILIIRLGGFKYSDIEEFQKYIEVFNIDVNGILVI